MSTIKWSGMTHPGRLRKSNQDAFLGLILYENEAHYLGKEDEHELGAHQFVFAVSDGMGGAMAGDFASKLILQSTTKRLPVAIKENDTQSKKARANLLAKMIKEIHGEVLSVARGYDECKGMGGTLSLCWIHSQGISFAHVGDSRIYKIPSGQSIEQVSEDHSEVGRLFRAGKLNERESKTHPRRHILDQCMGGRNHNVTPQIGELTWQKGDHIILCSDGICDGLYDRSIEATVVRPAPNIANLTISERLVKEALFSSGRDNLTSLVIELA